MSSPPKTRRTFRGPWDEVNYLLGKLLYWFYDRGDRGRATAYAQRLRGALASAPGQRDAILAEECRALIHEVEGDLAGAIRHRREEIARIKRLHESAKEEPGDAPALEGYGDADLSDRLDLLALLYQQAGRPDRAIEALRESERICAAGGIPFDGEEILREVLAERPGRDDDPSGDQQGRPGDRPAPRLHPQK